MMVMMMMMMMMMIKKTTVHGQYGYTFSFLLAVTSGDFSYSGNVIIGHTNLR